MITPPAATPQPYPPPTPDSQTVIRPSTPSRFGLFFGAVMTVLTLGAIALAAFAPQLTSAPTLQVPQGWQQVYSDNPGNTPALWDNTSGCSFPAQGLDVSSDATCAFQPANGVQLTNGVLIVAQLAPAADVSVSQDAGILLDRTITVLITQQGDYKICHGPCDTFTSTRGSIVSGATVAWHADAFVQNEIAVLYNTDQDTVSFYVNGQFVNQVSGGISAAPTIALTTSSSGEALFTHVAIYAGSLG